MQSKYKNKKFNSPTPKFGLTTLIWESLTQSLLLPGYLVLPGCPGCTWIQWDPVTTLTWVPRYLVTTLNWVRWYQVTTLTWVPGYQTRDCWWPGMEYDQVVSRCTYLIGVQSPFYPFRWWCRTLPKKLSFSIFQSLPHFPSLYENNMSGQSLQWSYGHPPWVRLNLEMKLL